MADEILDMGERLSDHAQDNVNPQPRAVVGLQAGCALRILGVCGAALSFAVGCAVAGLLASASWWLAAPAGAAIAVLGTWSSTRLTNVLVARALKDTLKAIEAPYTPGGIGGATPMGIPAIGSAAQRSPPHRRR